MRRNNDAYWGSPYHYNNGWSCPFNNAPYYRYPIINPYDCRNNAPIYRLQDYGPNPFVVNIDEITKQNSNYRTTLWTGDHLQITLMSIRAGGDIGLEMHDDVDQFIRIEQGQGLMRMGDTRDNLDFESYVYDDYAIVIPAGKWHNLINTGSIPLKLYSIYAPPQHPHGTVHRTKEDAEEAHE